MARHHSSEEHTKRLQAEMRHRLLHDTPVAANGKSRRVLKGQLRRIMGKTGWLNRPRPF